MEKNKITFGKRPGNPLIKRVWKDMWRDKKRYFMIFIMLVATIGMVSGIYVANNSMLDSLHKNEYTFERESGHFRLSDKTDKETIERIASGELADVPSVYRERAYLKADEEVRKTVDDAIGKNVENRVKESIRAEVVSAVNKQLSDTEKTGVKFSEEEKQSAIDEAYEKALSESFDSAYEEAFKQAKESDDYNKAINDALDEAHKEIDKEIDEKYNELSERYGLDEKFDPIPVKIYELFYKDTEEARSDGEKIGKVRVYPPREDIDRYDILEGRSPENENEIVIDRMHADNAKIKTGDILNIGGTDFEVVGLVSFVDYTALYESNTDTMFDALTFDVTMTTDEGFDRINSNTCANYAFTYVNSPSDEVEEKKTSDHFLKALITQVAVSENEDLKIEDYVPAYANNSITFAPNDLGHDKIMSSVLLYVLTAVMAFIFAVTISTTLEQESSVIGTLRASGYSRNELLWYYMSAPMIVVLFASLVGNVFGYTFFKDTIVDMYYSSYSLPGYETLWTPEAFIRTTIVPIVLMLVINFMIITRKLKLSPLRFLRHDIKRSKRKKAVRLPKWKFFSRFRVRVFLQNIPNYFMLFVGITFVMLLLSMAVGMPETLDCLQDSMSRSLFAQEQLILTSTKDDDGNIITTDANAAERFSITSLERKSDSYNEEVSVYGVEEDSSHIELSKYFCQNANEQDELQVYISQAYAEKYKVEAGDMIVLSEKYEHKEYRWKVYDIYDYTAGIAVFMTNEQFNKAFDKDNDDFSGYLCNEKITDIDNKYIAKEVTLDDTLKIARQLDHSLGAYMVYFRYVCFIVAANILYLLTKIIIEKNERSISMTKILGYNTAEIASVYLMPTAAVVLVSEFLAIFIGFKLMALLWKYMMMSMSGWFPFTMPFSGFVKEYVLVFAAYALITVIDFLRIRKIPKVLALKNVE